MIMKIQDIKGINNITITIIKTIPNINKSIAKGKRMIANNMDKIHLIIRTGTDIIAPIMHWQ